MTALLGERLEDRPLPPVRGSLLQLDRPVERRYRQRIVDVPRADEEQDSESVGQMVEEPSPWTHRSSKRPIPVSEREIDEKHFRCGGAAFGISCFHPQDGSVDRVEQQTVRTGSLRPAIPRCVENRSDVERALQGGPR